MASISVSKGLARALLGVETSDGRESVMFFSTMGESPSESRVSREVFGSRRVVVVSRCRPALFRSCSMMTDAILKEVGGGKGQVDERKGWGGG